MFLIFNQENFGKHLKKVSESVSMRLNNRSVVLDQPVIENQTNETDQEQQAATNESAWNDALARRKRTTKKKV